MESELEERSARRFVDVERLGLATRAVERDHECRDERLPERMLSDERPELGGKVLVPAQRERGLRVKLERPQAHLLKSLDLSLTGGREGRIRESASTPAHQRRR